VPGDHFPVRITPKAFYGYAMKRNSETEVDCLPQNRARRSRRLVAPNAVDGKIIQRRFNGRDGRAIKNVDKEAHHGHPNPHIHDWDWTKNPPRQPWRHPKKGEST
jgi:hypothetical protein